jgi:hypothetical protein
MSDQFDTPATGAKITEFDGALLLLTPTEHREGISTAFGDADAVVADLVVLDGPHAGQAHPGILVFQKALQGQLRPKVGTGRMVLGRLGRGIAKPGQSAPWILGDPTEADKTLARNHLASVAVAPF